MASITGNKVGTSTVYSYLYLSYDVSSPNSSGQVTVSNVVARWYAKNNDFDDRIYAKGTVTIKVGSNSFTWVSDQQTRPANYNAYKYSNTYGPFTISGGTGGYSFNISISGKLTIYGLTTSTVVAEGTSSTSTTINVPSVSSKHSVSTNVSEVNCDGSVTVSVGGGTGVTSYSLTYSCNGATGTLDSGVWHIPSNIEHAMTSVTSATCKITCTSYGSGGSLGSSSTNITIKIPENYVPVVNLYEPIMYNTTNGKMIAGESYFTCDYYTSTSPSNNTAEITSVVVKSVTVTPPTANVPTVTLDESTITSGIMPMPPSSVVIGSYNVAVVIQATDTRGRIGLSTITGLSNVYTYTPPETIFSQPFRCNAQGIEDVAGTYVSVNVHIVSDSELTTKSVVVTDVYGTTVTSGTLTLTEDNDYVCILGGSSGPTELLINSQYVITTSIRNQTMVTYGDAPIVSTQILSSMFMPISLYDDGYTKGVSVGEMAQDYTDITSNTYFNFSKDAELRASSDAGVVVADAYDIVGIKQNTLSNLKFVALTIEEYEELEDKDYDTIYLIEG